MTPANSLIAVGYEGGAVRLIESNKKEKPPFHEAYLTFQPHLNAILDLAFSSDDLLLATASGDQTSQVIDMPTQRAIATLSGHAASVKHVRFQPGSSNSVLATSSRDGSVQIWDLRCKGSNLPVGVLQQSLDPTETQRVSTIGKTSKMSWARSIGIVENAHMGRRIAHSSRAEKSGPAIDTDYKTDVVSSRGDISITGLSFLSPSLPHLLLTGSARHASVKLWDVRNIQNHRGRGQPIPLSTTRQPQSHDRHREYGLTSMLISPDGARLYTLCRDHTVYAYSTSHLILGSAPELDLWGGVPRQRSRNSPETSGLGPLYGFRHPGLHVTTFYVKMAIRPAKDNRTETLAVGSSDHCSVLFPTDERYMQGHGSRASSSNLEAPLPSTPSLPPGSGRISVDDSIPIYRNGSALVRGHDKEVTGVSWTSRGDLVTISDDFKARIWREDAARARDLRLVGEASGDRWGHGWAECQPGWDGSG
jgi:WD40 repeat protein